MPVVKMKKEILIATNIARRKIRTPQWRHVITEET